MHPYDTWQMVDATRQRQEDLWALAEQDRLARIARQPRPWRYWLGRHFIALGQRLTRSARETAATSADLHHLVRRS